MKSFKKQNLLRKTSCSFVFNVQLFPTRIEVPWLFWLSAVLVGRCTWCQFCGKLAHRKISMLLNIQCNTEAPIWKIVSMLWGREKVYWDKQLSNLDSSRDIEGLGSVLALSQLFTKVVSNADLPSLIGPAPVLPDLPWHSQIFLEPRRYLFAFKLHTAVPIF